MKKTALIFLAAIAMIACHHTHEEETYLLFLYNNMSLPDRLDNDTTYYRAQVEAALTARAELPWGHSVPEREFRHFVLPPRVNNEDLDDFRQRYYTELRDRVKGLTMSDAILEVNHWCHEHVTYRPTSSRTLGPVATIRTAYGRCGEESVLLVAALRTVGIPARQVYTPRWAHTDDNHAWVEAWADGKWHFLGACEPEPILDLGWFNESASRGMIMHTKVFGAYDGPEEVVKREPSCEKPLITEINVTEHYAPVTRLTITVVDSLERPVPNATVDFKLYNYAEFFTVASKTTDEAGRATFTAGHGTLLLWATASSSPATQPSTLSALRLVTLPADSVVTLSLRPTFSADGGIVDALAQGLSLDVTPPSASASLPEVTPEQRAENDRRLAHEDSIRHAYEATMRDEHSRGNYDGQHSYHKRADALGYDYLYLKLMRILPDKDLQQITFPVWCDACEIGVPKNRELSDIEQRYLLNPRIENELLVPYKEAISRQLTPVLASATDISTVGALMTWIRDSITVVDDQNPQRLRIRPVSVLRHRTADRLGRNIFFVAACRALGIPARINEIDGRLQYYDTKWHDVSFDIPVGDTSVLTTSKTAAGTSSRLTLVYKPTPYVPDAKYYTHFTLSRLGDDGRLQLLTFPEEATVSNTFADGVDLEAGTYVLTTGTRLANGSVLASLQALTLRPGIATRIPFTLRERRNAVSVIGSLNAENLYLPLTAAVTPDADSGLSTVAPTSLLSTTGRGYYILGLIAPGHEPTNHALRDIGLVADGLNSWGRPIVLLFDSTKAANRFNFAEFSLPSTTTWGTDINGTIRSELLEQLHLTNDALPLFVVADSFNRVVYVSQGYTIGLGEQLLKIIRQL